MTAPECYLCVSGRPRHIHGGSFAHGLRLDGVGMIDCNCPISKEAYDKLVGELREIAAVMRREKKCQS